MQTRTLALVLLGLVAFATVTPVAFADEDADEAEDAGDEEVVGDEEEEDYLDEDDVEEHPLTDMPLPSPDVITAGVFPKEDMSKPAFAIGKQVDTLIGIVNNGEEAINVTMIMGSLNSPFDFNFFIYNFSAMNYNMIVQGEEEYSFYYRFQTPNDLDPVDYQVALTVFYENDEELFSHTFFNGSVAFKDESDLVPTDALLKYIGGFAVSAMLFLMFKTIAAGSAGTVEPTPSNGSYDDDWGYGGDVAQTTTAGRKYSNKGKRRSSGRKKKKTN